MHMHYLPRGIKNYKLQKNKEYKWRADIATEFGQWRRFICLVMVGSCALLLYKIKLGSKRAEPYLGINN